jgi:hypothetical protein
MRGDRFFRSERAREMECDGAPGISHEIDAAALIAGDGSLRVLS